MTQETVCCPYCNTLTLVPTNVFAGQRMPCPRCGESFPYRSQAGQVVDAASDALDSTSYLRHYEASGMASRSPYRISNKFLAFLIVGIMGLAALIGLMFAWDPIQIRNDDWKLPKTQALAMPILVRVASGAYVVGLVVALLWGWNRRERRIGANAGSRFQRWGVPFLAAGILLAVGTALLIIPGRPTRPPLQLKAAPIAAVAPTALAGLGYLPDDTHILLGMHIAEITQTPSGKALIERSAHQRDNGLSALERWTGLKLADIDHIVVGITLADLLIPQTTIVVRTRQPYDQKIIRKALQATPNREPNTRPQYRFSFSKIPSEGYLWFVDPETIIITLRAKDCSRLPATPKSGVAHLPATIQTFLKERIPSATQLWAVGHVDSWDKIPLRLPLAALLQDEWKVISTIRTWGVGLCFDKDLTCQATFRCADEKDARELQKYITADPQGKQKLWQTLALVPEVELLRRPFGQTLKCHQKDNWIVLQAKATVSVR